MNENFQKLVVSMGNLNIKDVVAIRPLRYSVLNLAISRNKPWPVHNSDIVLMFSLLDIGEPSLTLQTVFNNAAQMIAGIANGYILHILSEQKTISMKMYGNSHGGQPKNR